MPVQSVPAITYDHHVGGAFDQDDLVPGIVDEAVVVLVGGQVAVAVVGGGCGPADGGYFVLFVG